jgi:predicted proteasome-type protease
MSVDCILNAAQTTEGVQHVLTHQDEPRKGEELIQAVDNIIDPTTAYLVTTINQVAQVQQRPLKNGQVSFWVGGQDVGVTPSLHTIEVDQAFYVRLASHIAEVCKARYAGSAGLICVHDSEACQKLIANPRSK